MNAQQILADSEVQAALDEWELALRQSHARAATYVELPVIRDLYDYASTVGWCTSFEDMMSETLEALMPFRSGNAGLPGRAKRTPGRWFSEPGYTSSGYMILRDIPGMGELSLLSNALNGATHLMGSVRSGRYPRGLMKDWSQVENVPFDKDFVLARIRSEREDLHPHLTEAMSEQDVLLSLDRDESEMLGEVDYEHQAGVADIMGRYGITVYANYTFAVDVTMAPPKHRLSNAAEGSDEDGMFEVLQPLVIRVAAETQRRVQPGECACMAADLSRYDVQANIANTSWVQSHVVVYCSHPACPNKP